MKTTMYNVVVTSPEYGIVAKHVAESLQSVLFTASASAEMAETVANQRIMMTLYTCDPDESHLEIKYHYADGDEFLHIVVDAVEVDDQPQDNEIPQQIKDQVSDIIALIQESSKAE